jgi:iron complex outermembrane receptor protein
MRGSKECVVRAVTIGLGVTLVLPGACWAQAQASAPTTATTDVLQEVVVTAEKFTENLQETPASIQVISGDELRAEGKQRIDDIMAGIAGVQAQANEVGSQFFMRGVGRNDGTLGPPGGGGPSQPVVAVMLDDVYQSRAEVVRGGTLDMSQVDVLRGPQSTTLGGSAMAGAVVLETNKPAFEYQASGTLTVGNYNQLSTEGVLNVPLSSNMALRFAASTDRHDGYYSDGADDADLQNLRGRFRWKPTDDLDIIVTVAHQLIGGNDVLQGALSYEGFWVPYGQCTQSGVAGAKYNCNDTTEGAGPMTVGFPPSYGHVDNGVTYLNRSNPWDDGLPPNQFGHGTGYTTTLTQYYANVDMNLPFATLTVVPSYETGQFHTTVFGAADSYSQENQQYNTKQIDAHLNSLPDSKLIWLLGLNYFNYDLSPGNQAFIGYPGASIPFGNCPATSTTDCYFWTSYLTDQQITDSVYANMQYPIVNSLRLIGGLRYSHDEKKLVTQENPPGVGGPPFMPGSPVGPTASVPFAGSSGTWSNVNYRAGLQYDLTPKIMAYGTYSTGYQPGNVLGQGPGFITTQKQILDNIALGLKSRFFDDTLQVDIEAFDAKYFNRTASNNIVATRGNSLGTAPSSCTPIPGDNEQLQVSADYTCITLNSNALTIPTLMSKGIDLDITWLVTRDDIVNISAEYLKATQVEPISSVALTPAQFATLGGTSAIANPIASGDAAGAAAALNSVLSSYNGAPLQASPQLSGNFTYRHNFKIAGHGVLTPEFNMLFKSNYWVAQGGLSIYTPQNPGPAEQSAYELYNAALRWTSDDGKFTLSAYVKNIADKPILDSWNDVGSFYGPAYVALEPPRTYGVIAHVQL